MRGCASFGTVILAKGTGDDWILGGLGDDVANGGDGDDIIIVRAGDVGSLSDYRRSAGEPDSPSPHRAKHRADLIDANLRSNQL